MRKTPTFPLNAWYAAGWDAEIGRHLLPRTVCGKKIVLYRDTHDRAVALEDACWHRLVPLSKGRLRGDDVQCGYHGIVYNKQGCAVHMPSQETINPSACVRAFPVAERDRFVWVWPGDPALADEALLPDLHWNHHPGWAGDGGQFEVACDYRLIVDNLMDLTHETYLHSGSIGNDAVAEAPFEVTHGEHSVVVTRWMLDIEPPPFWRAQLRKPGKVDRWQIIHFTPPGTIAIDVGVAPAGSGAPEGDRSQGVNFWVVNSMTPESDGRCRYYWSNPRNYRIDEQRVTTEIKNGVTQLFLEDVHMLEAQQRAIDEHPGYDFYNLNIDAGAMWARRLIDKMIAREQGLRVAAE